MGMKEWLVTGWQSESPHKYCVEITRFLFFKFMYNWWWEFYVQFLFGINCVAPVGAEESGGSFLKKLSYKSFLALNPRPINSVSGYSRTWVVGRAVKIRRGALVCDRRPLPGCWLAYTADPSEWPGSSFGEISAVDYFWRKFDGNELLRRRWSSWGRFLW